jgi:hypothetical protein
MRSWHILISLCFLAVANAQPPLELGWKDLIPTDSVHEEPFKKLNPEEIENLFTVARYRLLEEYSPESVTEAIQLEKDSLERWLTHEGVATDSLIALSFQFAEMREQRAKGLVQELGGKIVRIPGYMLPLDYSAERVNEFLLVPWVGACIHTPPPPRNQIVFVRLAEGYEHKSIYEPVWVSGKMSTGEKTSELFLVDGSDNITSGYSLLESTVSPYKPNE